MSHDGTKEEIIIGSSSSVSTLTSNDNSEMLSTYPYAQNAIK
jgi:hypothetical protein